MQVLVAIVMAFEGIWTPQPHFVHQIHIIIFKRCDLRVRRLVIVIVEQLPATAGDSIRELNAQTPPCNVDLVYTVIAHITCSIIPEPVPFIVVSI